MSRSRWSRSSRRTSRPAATDAHRSRVAAAALTSTLLAAPLLLAGASSAATHAGGARTSVVLYDGFNAEQGYDLDDYAGKWANPFGLGEMAVADTRSFGGNRLHVSVAPFRTGADVSVYDHLKYIAISTQSFPVPTEGSVEVSSTIRVDTPGTQAGRVITGTYTQSGAPYASTTLEGQQAGAVMNVVDFATGQLFDWFVSGSTAFALIERLPSSVTGGTSETSSPDYVGREKMYTQIIREVAVTPGVEHRVSIRFTRGPDGSSADYYLDGTLVAHVERIGVPLDVQGVDYTGYAPSLGAGEDLDSKINSLSIGHGLFSLLDAFPYQHPDSPELSVSIPVENRLFGQGAVASFDTFKVKTTRSP